MEKYIDDFVQDSDLASANIYSESLTASQRQNMNLVKIELEKILEKIYE
ncbi:MAG: hypothetical protein LBQ59_01655 [Candidatus Peribacteria bacterium]|nr:hypothetical protein [Candidatus Peribacteria bacterium]